MGLPQGVGMPGGGRLAVSPASGGRRPSSAPETQAHATYEDAAHTATWSERYTIRTLQGIY